MTNSWSKNFVRSCGFREVFTGWLSSVKAFDNALYNSMELLRGSFTSFPFVIELNIFD